MSILLTVISGWFRSFGFVSSGSRCLAVLLAIGSFVIAMAAPVHAQNLMPGFRLGEEKEVSEDEKARNKANEDAARAASRSVAAPKVSNDPWADVRGTEASTSAKSKKPAK